MERKIYEEKFYGSAALYGLFCYICMNAHRFKEPGIFRKLDKEYSVEFGQFYSTYAMYHAWTGMSYRTIKNNLTMLEKLGCIHWKQLKNCIRVDVPIDIFQYVCGDKTLQTQSSISTNGHSDKETKGQGDKDNIKDNKLSCQKAELSKPILTENANGSKIPSEGKKEPDQYQSTPKQFLDIWNENRGTLPTIRKLSDVRSKQIKVRLREEPDLEYWKSVIKRLAESRFACGGGNTNWVATLDWLIKNGNNHVKVSEGKYDDKDKNNFVKNQNQENDPRARYRNDISPDELPF